MAEEITRITYDSIGTIGKNEVLNLFQDRETHNLTTPVGVTLMCRDAEEFSETAEMRTVFFENIVHIKRFRIFNFCKKRDENLAWFNYLLQFIQTDHGGTKYVVEYCNLLGGCVNHVSLENAIKLSDALLLNNNDNDNSHIEKFSLGDNFCNDEAFQIIWNALLETGVPYIELSPKFSENRDSGNNNNNDNNNINFTGLSTNISVKRLDFDGYDMSQQNWRNLFNIIKGNKGLERLSIDHSRSLNNAETLACFKEMLRKNITLIDVDASFDDDDEKNGIDSVITIETKFNRLWKQYLIKRKEEEDENASAITTPPHLPVHLAEASERKRRFKMRYLLAAFENKSVIRDTILFHNLSETPVLLIDDEVQQNLNQVFRNNNKKRPRL